MSKENVDVAGDGGGDFDLVARQEREKSVKPNGAPPPSPEADADETMTGTMFGPSEKMDEDGKMAMVPANQVGPTCYVSRSWSSLMVM